MRRTGPAEALVELIARYFELGEVTIAVRLSVATLSLRCISSPLRRASCALPIRCSSRKGASTRARSSSSRCQARARPASVGSGFSVTTQCGEERGVVQHPPGPRRHRVLFRSRMGVASAVQVRSAEVIDRASICAADLPQSQPSGRLSGRYPGFATKGWYADRLSQEHSSPGRSGEAKVGYRCIRRVARRA